MANVEKADRKFPVKLKTGYYPADPNWPKHPLSGDPVKVLKDQTVELPIEEARRLIMDGIAERADGIPLP